MKLAVGLLAAATLCTGCDHLFHARVQGSGNSKTEHRALKDFHTVHLAGAMDVTVKQGDQFDVELMADDNILPIIVTKVSGSDLVIETKEDYTSHLKIHVTVTAPAVDSVELEGSGNIQLQGTKTDSMAVSISGSGTIDGSGSSDKLAASVNGSGDINLKDFQAKTAQVSIAGSGSAHISAEKTLDATINGSGEIRYYGDPEVNKSINGSGSITKAQ